MSRESTTVSKIHLDRRQFSAVAAATAATAASSRALLGQEATPASEDAGAASEVQIEVLASGLLDPRFVAVDGETIYVTEAGNGGETEVFEVAGQATPAPAAPISMQGYTGRLSSVDADGTVTAIVDDFISYTFGGNGEIVGAAGVAIADGKAYVTVGAPGPYVGVMNLTGEEGALYEVDLATGEKRVVADLAAYEIENNPDPVAIDSNLFGVAVRDGIAYVVDAGGNSILAVDIASGEISTFAVTGGLEAPFLPESGNPMRGGEMEIDSVPSGIKVGPDDRLYVSYVTGGPFPPDLAPIDAFMIDGQQETVASGLTMVSDIAFGPDGHLYACVMSTDMVNGGPGQIVRVMSDGNHLVVVDGLMLPNGIAFDADGHLLVTNKASFAPEGGGELLHISGVIEAAGTPFVVPQPEA
ncbi:MAG TPA: ScyD/ScyE family protein [Thermomicrobiales bacterium]|nr:ScyD/ScyE family protein [Thermomicrobiales bacterium]